MKISLWRRVGGIDGFELCYPGDFGNASRLKELLAEHGYGVSAINFRSRRTGSWLRGSFSSADATERQQVVEDLYRVMDYAADLGCNRVTTCPLNDGTDYVFEADYNDLYRYAEETFAQICAHNPAVKCASIMWMTRGRGACRHPSRRWPLPDRAPQPRRHARHWPLAVGPRATRPAWRAGARWPPVFVHVNDNDRSWDWT